MKKIVFATNNSHKLEEARAIIGDNFEIVSLEDIGCHEDIPETSTTLEGNALQKARYIHDRFGVNVFADDTGLMVDSLGGEPGVYSARYAGPGHDSAANTRKLLRKLEDKSDRNAHFSTVVALILDNKEYIFEGRVDGRIASFPSGEKGFGYDPVFIPENSAVTFAEMSAEDKNLISHRGRAMRKLADFLK
ncbi:MAG: non-canonical purine NTP diphosphatase [Bacteroidales bacterium]|nr:non-canonical purine NTP diphosphatase [Bacteroidales bacterium]